MVNLVCPLCASPLFSTLTKLLRHIHIIHADDTSLSIQCNLQGCSRTFKKFKTYQTHIYTYHNTTSLELTSEQCGLEAMEEHEHDCMNSELDSEGYEGSQDEVQGKYLLHVN